MTSSSNSTNRHTMTTHTLRYTLNNLQGGDMSSGQVPLSSKVWLLNFKLGTLPDPTHIVTLS